MKLLLLSCLLLCVISVGVVSSYSCRDGHGRSVDWFVIQKIPELVDHPNPLVSTGFAHLYLDSNTPQWTLSNVSLGEARGHAFYHTLTQLYDKKDKSASIHVLYNDQLPNSRNYTEVYGHTKGFLGFEKSGGFWVKHTIPRFPQKVSQGYFYPHSARMYGQSAMCVSLNYKYLDVIVPGCMVRVPCVSLNYKYLDVIGKQFRYSYPWVYDSHLPESMVADNPNLSAYLTDPGSAHPTDAPWYSQVPIVSVAGTHFTSFDKFNDFEQDLYGALISQTYETSFYVESWMHQKKETFLSNCTNDYRVYNVQDLSFPHEIDYTNHYDHSKWAVSVSSKDNPIFCMADINRVETQLRRGGGALCFSNKWVWHGFNSAVTSYCKCDQEDCY